MNKASFPQFESAFQASGLSVKIFCAKHGIKPTTYYYWRRKLDALQHPKNGFVEIKVKDSKPKLVSAIILRVGSAALEIPEHVSSKSLALILCAIREAKLC
jgi:transposase-like protein